MTFAKYSAAVQKNYERKFDITVKEIQDLRREIDTWGEEYFKRISDVLEMYGIFNVPQSILKNLCKEYLGEVALEVFDNATTDTVVREDILAALVQELNIEDEWPTYGTHPDRAKEFFKEFAQKCESCGITFFKG